MIEASVTVASIPASVLLPEAALPSKDITVTPSLLQLIFSRIGITDKNLASTILYDGFSY